MKVLPRDLIDLIEVPTTKAEAVKLAVRRTVIRFGTQQYKIAHILKVCEAEFEGISRSRLMKVIPRELELMAKLKLVRIVIQGKSGRPGVYQNRGDTK